MRILPLGLFALACQQDYDLAGEKKENPPPDTQEPEPEEEDSDPPPPDPDPDIAVSPLGFDFGGLPKDCAADDQTLVITNEGEGTLEVSTIEVTGDGNSAFTLRWDGAPFSLAQGELREIPFGFTPNAWVSYSVEVQVESNDPDEGLVSLPAEGFGAEDVLYEQSFVQENFESVDVLWVIDNSGSMSEETNQVVVNFANFIDAFIGLGLDYHIGVVTTDMDAPEQSGRLVGPVVTSDTPDPEDAFLALISLGYAGSADERGFDAAKAALSEPLLSTENAGFLREEAGLSVIVLSDENDSSAMNAVTFSSWFDGLKADPETSSFSAICGDRFLGCTELDIFGSSLSATGGDEYIDAAELTGGFWASICTEDYDEVLTHLSLTSAGMTISFVLDYEPTTLADVTVTVSGAEIPFSITDGWSYDEELNAVIFHGSSIPEPGATVIVSYPIPSECPS